MSTATLCRPASLAAIHVWWRSENKLGVMPSRLQGWHVTVVHVAGYAETYKLPDEIGEQCDCMAEAVRLVAESRGLSISVDHVRNHWTRRTATWKKGT